MQYVGALIGTLIVEDYASTDAVSVDTAKAGITSSTVNVVLLSLRALITVIVDGSIVNRLPFSVVIF